MEEYRDGGFPITDNPNDRASHQASAPHFSSLNASVVHELGHTCLALPDVYSYPVRWHNVLLTVLKEMQNVMFFMRLMKSLQRQQVLPLDLFKQMI